MPLVRAAAKSSRLNSVLIGRAFFTYYFVSSEAKFAEEAVPSILNYKNLIP